MKRSFVLLVFTVLVAGLMLGQDVTPTPTQTPTPTKDPTKSTTEAPVPLPTSTTSILPTVLPTTEVPTVISQPLTWAEAQTQCIASGISALDVARLNECINRLMNP